MATSGEEEESKFQDRQGQADDDVPDSTVKHLTKVATLHAVIISGLEFALSLINALVADAFKLNSLTNAVFGASAAMEAVGLVFAMYMALFGGDDIGGSPLLTIWAVWETRLTRSNTRRFDEDADVWNKILLVD